MNNIFKELEQTLSENVKFLVENKKLIFYYLNRESLKFQYPHTPL